MKREAINHTKMRRLARFLGIEVWGARGIMESLWAITRDEAPAGNIGKLSDEDLADFIGWEGGASKLIQAMVQAGWLDPDPTYRLIVHDWPEHCEDYIHAKIARAGIRFANGSLPNTGKLSQKQRDRLPKEFYPPAASDLSDKDLSAKSDGSDPEAATKSDGSDYVAATTSDRSGIVAAIKSDGSDMVARTHPIPSHPIQAHPIHTKPPVHIGSASMSQRFEEFWGRPYWKKLRKDLAAGVWAHEVTTENEDAVFACLANYDKSAEVARGAVMNPENWLSECAACGFTATWPEAKDRGVAIGGVRPEYSKPHPSSIL